MSSNSVRLRKSTPIAKAWSILVLTVYFICTTLFLCIVIPTFVLPIVLYHWLVARCASIFRPDLSHMLRYHGPLTLQAEVSKEPRMNLVLTFTVQQKEELDFEKVKTMIGERLVHARTSKSKNAELAYPELQQFITRWAGYFFWKKETDFSIDGHVCRRDLSPGEDVLQVQHAFLQQPLPQCKSPWQILLVATPGAGPYHILIKFHHVFADGYSSIRAFMRLTDEPGPIFLPLPTVPAWQRGIRFKLTFLFHFVLALALMRTTKSPALPWTPLPWEPITGDRPLRHSVVISEQAVNMKRVKAIAKQLNISTNAAVQAGLTGALRNSMLAKHAPDTIPDHVSFQQALSSFYHPPGVCNYVRMVTYRLPVGEAGTLARLQYCDRMLADVKQSVEGDAMLLLFSFLIRLPVVFPFQQVLQRLGPAVVIGTTNLPGPLNLVRFDGHAVTDMNLLLLESPSSFYISMISYAGEMRFMCTGDSRVMSRGEVQEIGRLFVEEFEVIEGLTSGAKACNS